MKIVKLSNGVVHNVPKDLRQMLTSQSKLTETWEDITPLARNEWICWITSAKKEETRQKRINLAQKQLLNGKRRPCCWAGCPHRNN